MNSIFLILCTLVIYYFGYRYFARFLQTKLFQLPAGAGQAPSKSIVDRFLKTGSERHELQGFHFATITTLSTISGASVAVFWGWAPAYLWLLVGSSVAAGSFAMGSLWLRRNSLKTGTDTGVGTGLIPELHRSLSKRLVAPVAILLALSLIVIAGLLVYLSAIMLVSFPSITWPLLWIVIVVSILSRVLANQAAVIGSRGTSYLVAMVVILLSIWISRGWTIGFSGVLNFDVSGHSLVSADGITVWGTLILLLSTWVQRKPFEAWQKTFGVLTAIMTIMMLLAFYTGILISHPTMSAPAFVSGQSPGILPWLFLTLSTGAYAGLHFLFAYSVTAPRMQTDSDVRYIGYGAALLEGLFTLSVILAFGALIGNQAVWAGLYQDWTALPDGSAMLGHYVNGVINAVGHAGFGNHFAETWVALVITCLALVSAIALIRVLRVFLQELGVRYRAEPLGAVKTASWTGLGLLLLPLLLLNVSDNIKTLEQLLGAGQYLLASLGLLLILNSLSGRPAPSGPGWVLFGLTVALSLLGSGALLLDWLDDAASLRFLIGMMLLLLQLVLVTHIGLKFVHTRQSRSASPEPGPPES
jgi:carbon starvation protein